MTQQNYGLDKQPDQFSVKQIVLMTGSLNRYLLAQWKILLLLLVVGGVCGYLYASFRKTLYIAECTFVLEEGGGSSGASGGYSVLASLAGVDLGNSSGLFQGDNIIQLYKSRLMIEKTLLTPASFNGKNELLIDRFIEMNKLRKAWDSNPVTRHLSFNIPKEKFTTIHDSIINVIVFNLNQSYLYVDKPDKKLSIISVRINAPDPLFAKAFTEAIVSNVNSFYIQTKTKSSLQNLRLFQRQADSIRAVLASSVRGSASALDANPDPNPALQVLRVRSQNHQIDIQSNSAIYAEAVKNLEVARGSLQRETPLIQLIDQPVLPLPNDRISRLKSLISGAIIAGILGLIVLTTRRIYNKILI